MTGGPVVRAAIQDARPFEPAGWRDTMASASEPSPRALRRITPMKSPLSTIAVLLVLGASARASDAPRPPARVLILASDFPSLEQGVDLGVQGEADFLAWAAAGDDWRLTEHDGRIVLHRTARSQETSPRWTHLGKLALKPGREIKITVDAGPAAAKPAKTSSTRGTKPTIDHAPAAPALLWIDTEGKAPPTLDIIRGRIDDIAPTLDLRRSTVRTNYDGVGFQAPATAEQWRDRAAHLRDQLSVTLGLWPGFPRSPLHPMIHGKLDRGDYTIEKVVLETLPGFTLSGNLYRPAHSAGKRPAVLCPHGHWEDGRMNPEVQMRCIRLAKLGCVVFMYDMVGYNDSKPFTHEFLNDHLRQFGLSLPTLQTWNSLRAVDWISALPDVDPARIGCTGESGGGTQTFLLTALDPRIAVSAPIVMVSDTFQGGCVCENAAGLRIGTDNVEIAALTAPRPLMMVGASGDWTAKTMDRAYPAIRGVYTLVGSTDRVSARVFDFPHNYNQTSRNAVYPFLARWLLGMTDDSSTREGAQRPETAAELSTWDSGNPRPSNRKTPEQLEAYLTDEIQKGVDALGPHDAPQWTAARQMLQTMLRVRAGLANPAPDQLTIAKIRVVAHEDAAIEHLVVGRRGVGDAVPIVRITPRRSTNRSTVIASARGKAALVDATGEPTLLVRELLKLGNSVVGFDPIFVGEALDCQNPVRKRPGAVHFETYNPTLAADQIQDLATTMAWVRAQPDARSASLIALDSGGAQALLALPLLENVARAFIALEPRPKPTQDGPVALSLDLPGLAQFGGWKTAAALAAPTPLWVAGRGLDAAWAKESYGLAGASHALKIDDDQPKPGRLARWIALGE